MAFPNFPDLETKNAETGLCGGEKRRISVEISRGVAPFRIRSIERASTNCEEFGITRGIERRRFFSKFRLGSAEINREILLLSTNEFETKLEKWKNFLS